MLLVAENMPPTSEFVPLIGKSRRPYRLGPSVHLYIYSLLHVYVLKKVVQIWSVYSEVINRPWIFGRSRLLIYSFQFMSAFQTPCANWFSQFHFQFSINRLHFSSCVREIWRVSDLDLDRINVNHLVIYRVKGHFVESYVSGLTQTPNRVLRLDHYVVNISTTWSVTRRWPMHWTHATPKNNSPCKRTSPNEKEHEHTWSCNFTLDWNCYNYFTYLTRCRPIPNGT